MSFLNPYGDAPLEPDQQVDISHEALIRWWQRIADPEDGWLRHEFRDGLVWKTLLVMAGKGETLSAAATVDRGKWLRTLPSEAWAERYGGDWSQVKGLIERSDELAEQREEERQRDAKERVKRAEEIAAKGEQLREAQRRRAEDAIASQRRQRRWTIAGAGSRGDRDRRRCLCLDSRANGPIRRHWLLRRLGRRPRSNAMPRSRLRPRRRSNVRALIKLPRRPKTPFGNRKFPVPRCSPP